MRIRPGELCASQAAHRVLTCKKTVIHKVNCRAAAREGGLGHLSQRLDEMELAIHKPSFRKGTGRANEVNYWVFDYPPEKELEVRERVEYLKNKNDRGDDDFELVVFDLYDIIIDFLEKKNFMEKKRKKLVK